MPLANGRLQSSVALNHVWRAASGTLQCWLAMCLASSFCQHSGHVRASLEFLNRLDFDLEGLCSASNTVFNDGLRGLSIRRKEIKFCES